MTEEFREYDPARYLKTAEAINIFIEDALETDNAEHIAYALSVAERARQIINQKEQKQSEEQPYKSFTAEATKTLEKFMAFLQSLNIKLIITPTT